MNISIDFGGFEIIEKTASRFGNSAHILVKKELAGKNVKIVLGNSKQEKNNIKINLFDSEIIERKVKKFGTGAHIIVPKEYSNKKLKLIYRGKNE